MDETAGNNFSFVNITGQGGPADDRSRKERMALGPQAATNNTSAAPAKAKYGLGGLIEFLRKGTAIEHLLTMGRDLNTLGLNITSNEPLFPGFASPWMGSTGQPTMPDFTTPECYQLTSLQHFPVDRVSRFEIDTLFYIFYTLPRDHIQQAAALELTKRGWIYHTDPRIWLLRSPSDPPEKKDPHSEAGRYTYFDPRQWKMVEKDLVIRYDQLADFGNKN